MSLKNTAIAARIKLIPKPKKYTWNTTTGKNKIFHVGSTLVNTITKTRAIRENNKLTKELVTLATVNTYLGT